MNKPIPLLHIEEAYPCTIVERINRFTVLIKHDNKYHTAWINNTGRLEEYMRKGIGGFCIPNKGKNKYRLFAVKPNLDNNGYASVIDTLLQMKSFERCIEEKLLPYFQECWIEKRNPQLYNSYVDYLLRCNNKNIYVEIKSAVLQKENHAMYPDCPSTRGERHIEELIRYARNNGESSLLFIAALPWIKSFKPFKEGDSRIYTLIHQAYRNGVKIRAIQIAYDISKSTIILLDNNLPVILPEVE